MLLSIIVPDSQTLEEQDLDSLYIQLTQCARRNAIFSGETVEGYVIYSSVVDPAPENIQVRFFLSECEQLAKAVRNDPEDVTEVDAELVAQGISDMGDTTENLAIWKFSAHIVSPKSKLGKSVTLEASMIDAEHSDLNGQHKSNEDPKVSSPSLSETTSNAESPQSGPESTKIGNIQPVGSKEDEPATVVVTETFPVYLPLMMKLKSTKPGGRNDILLSSLSIEASEDLLKFSKEGKYENLLFTILDLSVKFPTGKITSLSSLEIPSSFGVHDIISTTYRLVNNGDQMPENSQPLHITLSSRIDFIEGKERQQVGSDIISQWTPLLDFSLMAPPISNSLKSSTNMSHSQLQQQFQIPQKSRSSQNLQRKDFSSTPTFATSPSVPHINFPGTPSSKSSYGIPQRVKSPNPAPGRTQSMNALSQGGQNHNLGNKPIKRNYKSLLSHALSMSPSAVTINLTTTNNTALSGLRLTFLGRLDVELGKVATLRIQAINLSSRTLHLSLIVKNPTKFGPVYSSNNVATSSASSSNVISGKDSNSQKVLVHSRQQLFHQYQQSKLETCGVIMLTNDVRLGPIEPNAVYESEVDIIGISKGVFNLQGLKIFDIASGDGIDFGKLMEVFVI
ncbi:hypothetical protein ACI3LY_003007 [Candidozyma auris]|uniref:Trafficking protein particle complex II-specific subunit 65 IgD3 domain-containing protein n=1 Tax=Candidozyma auris TaxID=498019 RepID=A0A2H0ZN89_CANAR|nr:hypothetical protein QG37_04941 [[Candida] auris]PIS52094.1 hypothetical protein B9J08_003705 [[Candida] auris]